MVAMSPDEIERNPSRARVEDVLCAWVLLAALIAAFTLAAVVVTGAPLGLM